MCIRFCLNVRFPLKRKMKIKKPGDDWFRVSFKYECLPTFCYLCGKLSHSEKFCALLFDKKTLLVP